MSVKFAPADKRASIAAEHNANLANWMHIGVTGNILGTLPKYPEPKLDANGNTKTQARYKNRQDGKHNPPPHQRRTSTPRSGSRAENCSTCGALRATILFHSTQYHSMHCIPMVGSVARTR